MSKPKSPPDDFFLDDEDELSQHSAEDPDLYDDGPALHLPRDEKAARVTEPKAKSEEKTAGEPMPRKAKSDQVKAAEKAIESANPNAGTLQIKLYDPSSQAQGGGMTFLQEWNNVPPEEATRIEQFIISQFDEPPPYNMPVYVEVYVIDDAGKATGPKPRKFTVPGQFGPDPNRQRPTWGNGMPSMSPPQGTFRPSPLGAPNGSSGFDSPPWWMHAFMRGNRNSDDGNSAEVKALRDALDRERQEKAEEKRKAEIAEMQRRHDKEQAELKAQMARIEQNLSKPKENGVTEIMTALVPVLQGGFQMIAAMIASSKDDAKTKLEVARMEAETRRAEMKQEAEARDRMHQQMRDADREANNRLLSILMQPDKSAETQAMLITQMSQMAASSVRNSAAMLQTMIELTSSDDPWYVAIAKDTAQSLQGILEGFAQQRQLMAGERDDEDDYDDDPDAPVEDRADRAHHEPRAGVDAAEMDLDFITFLKHPKSQILGLCKQENNPDAWGRAILGVMGWRHEHMEDDPIESAFYQDPGGISLALLQVLGVSDEFAANAQGSLEAIFEQIRAEEEEAAEGIAEGMDDDPLAGVADGDEEPEEPVGEVIDIQPQRKPEPVPVKKRKKAKK